MDKINEQSELNTRNSFVKMSMEAGVAPLELHFTQVNDLTYQKPVAYRSKAVVNSVLLGKLEEEQYDSAMTLSPVGVELSKWGLRELVELVNRMEHANRDFDWISFVCPPSILVREDIYSYMQKLIAENAVEHPRKICIEFPNTLLLENQKKIKQLLLDLKLLGITLMMNGCAADNCPVHSLAELPLDYVIMDPSINPMIKNEKKANVLNALMQYVKSMDMQAIVCEIMDDTEVKKLNVSDFYGYVPSLMYVGDGSHGSERVIVTSTGEELVEW